MRSLVAWLQRHKIGLSLVAVIAFLLWRDNFPGLVSRARLRQEALTDGPSMGMTADFGSPLMSRGISNPSFPPIQDGYPPTDTADRLVIRDTSLSIVVKDVADSIGKIKQSAEALGGYLVSSHLSKPAESGNGTTTVRVPEDKLDQALISFRSTGIRVVDERISGRDVTDEYVDLDARLQTLNKTKLKFEEILDQATQVPDLLNVQRELVNLQAQIDNLKGQQLYLAQSAKLSKVTVYLSTDELSLPYAPAQPWRPSVVFKMAVRSLVGTLRSAGTALIWIGVYSPIWLPITGLVWYLSRRKRLLPASPTSASTPAAGKPAPATKS